MILDGGPCPLGIESTVVSVARTACRFCSGRAPLPREAIERVLGAPLAAAKPNHRGRFARDSSQPIMRRARRFSLDATRVAAGEALARLRP